MYIADILWSSVAHELNISLRAISCSTNLIS